MLWQGLPQKKYILYFQESFSDKGNIKEIEGKVEKKKEGEGKLFQVNKKQDRIC